MRDDPHPPPFVCVAHDPFVLFIRIVAILSRMALRFLPLFGFFAHYNPAGYDYTVVVVINYGTKAVRLECSTWPLP